MIIFQYRPCGVRITRFLFEPTLLLGESGFVCGINAFNGLRKQARGHPPALAGSNNYETNGIAGSFFDRWFDIWKIF